MEGQNPESNYRQLVLSKGWKQIKHTSSLFAFVSAAPGCEAPPVASAPPGVSLDLDEENIEEGELVNAETVCSTLTLQTKSKTDQPQKNLQVDT